MSFANNKSVTGRVAVLVVIAVVALALSFAFGTAAANDGAGIVKSAGEASSASLPEGPMGILYDQTAPLSGNGAPDQDFEAAFEQYSSEGADDFVVPAGGWTIEGVNTLGTQNAGGSPASVDVWFYPDNAGMPGAVAECEYLGVATASPANLSVTLPAPCVLEDAGTWWIAIQTNQDFGTSGQHFWSGIALASTSGNPGVWRNPGDGFGTGCTDWTVQSTCGVGGGVADDWAFQLLGTEGVPADPPEIELAKTVSNDGTCGATDSLDIPGNVGGTDVTYCFTMTNSGTVTVTYHTLVDSHLGTLVGPGLELDVAPGDSVEILATTTITETTVNTGTWTIEDVTGAPLVEASATAEVCFGCTPTSVSLSGIGGESSALTPLWLGAVLVVIVGLGLALRRKVTA